MSHKQARLFPRTEEIFDPLHLQAVVPRRHAHVTYGVAHPPGIGIFVACILKPPDFPQGRQREEGDHELGVPRVEQDEIRLEFRNGVLLAGLDRSLHFLLQRNGNGDDGNPFAVQFPDNVRRERLLQEFAGPAHGADLASFFAYEFTNAAEGRDACPTPESQAAKNTENAAVSVLRTLAGRARRPRCIDIGAGRKTDRLVSFLAENGGNGAVLHCHVVDAGGHPDFDSLGFQEGPDDGFHRGHVIKRRVRMSGKLDVAVEGVGVRQLEEIAPSHGEHLFGGGETAVVAHDPAHEPRA